MQKIYDNQTALELAQSLRRTAIVDLIKKDQGYVKNSWCLLS